MDEGQQHLCYIEHLMDTTIRNLDEAIYRSAKARAVLEGRNLGELVSEALRLYLERSADRRPSGSLGDLEPEPYPEGCERLSEEIDGWVYATGRETG